MSLLCDKKHSKTKTTFLIKCHYFPIIANALSMPKNIYSTMALPCHFPEESLIGNSVSGSGCVGSFDCSAQALPCGQNLHLSICFVKMVRFFNSGLPRHLRTGELNWLAQKQSKVGRTLVKSPDPPCLQQLGSGSMLGFL